MFFPPLIIGKTIVLLCSVCFVGVEFPTCTVEVFRVLERIDYPRDANGNIIAMVHPNLQVKTRMVWFMPAFFLSPTCLSCWATYLVDVRPCLHFFLSPPLWSLLAVVSGRGLGAAEPRWPDVPNVWREDPPLPRLRHHLSHFHKRGGLLWKTAGVRNDQARNLGGERHQKSMRAALRG